MADPYYEDSDCLPVSHRAQALSKYSPQKANFAKADVMYNYSKMK